MTTSALFSPFAAWQSHGRSLFPGVLAEQSA